MRSLPGYHPIIITSYACCKTYTDAQGKLNFSQHFETDNNGIVQNNEQSKRQHRNPQRQSKRCGENIALMSGNQPSAIATLLFSLRNECYYGIARIE